MLMSRNPFQFVLAECHVIRRTPLRHLGEKAVDAFGLQKGAVTRVRCSGAGWSRASLSALREQRDVIPASPGILREELTRLCQEKGADLRLAERFGRFAADVICGSTDMTVLPRKGVEAAADYAAGRALMAGEFSHEDEKAVSECIVRAMEFEERVESALFGRGDVRGASCFRHAVSIHGFNMEGDPLEAGRFGEGGESGSGIRVDSDVLFYGYASVNLGTLWENLAGNGVDEALRAFIRAAHAGPSSDGGTVEYARVLLRRGCGMQIAWLKPVRSDGSGFLDPGKRALDAAVMRNESLTGSHYGKIADFAFGEDPEFSIDSLADALSEAVREVGRQ